MIAVTVIIFGRTRSTAPAMVAARRSSRVKFRPSLAQRARLSARRQRARAQRRSRLCCRRRAIDGGRAPISRLAPRPGAREALAHRRISHIETAAKVAVKSTLRSRGADPPEKEKAPPGGKGGALESNKGGGTPSRALR
jgi:hypothetical protein